MIRMISQPIVNMRKKQVVREEWLCRPTSMSIAEFFAVSDPVALWERESLCIQETIQINSAKPKSINLTLSSLPYFLQTNLHWNGGIELVEWGHPVLENYPLQEYVQQLLQRGLEVWVDDLTIDQWGIWKALPVTGYKIARLQDHQDPRFIYEVIHTGKPIVLEWIETEEEEKVALDLGIQYGQGHMYMNQLGYPIQRNSKTG